MQIEQERKLSPDETVFLDRALPDALAYFRFLKLEPDQNFLEAISRFIYKKVFILEPLPLVSDYARTEDVTAQKELHKLLTEVYQALPAPVVRVPVLPANERVDFILKELLQTSVQRP